MNNLFGVRYRLVLRVVLLQVGCATVAGLLFWMMAGGAAAMAAFAGGMIVVVGTSLFGWRMFAPGIAPAARLFRALVAAESLGGFCAVEVAAAAAGDRAGHCAVRILDWNGHVETRKLNGSSARE
jgi:hypothetical protein